MTEHQHRILMSSANANWITPPDLFAKLDRIFNFTLDPAANSYSYKCPRYFSERDNGLKRYWCGKNAFLNPPYVKGITIKWMEKAAHESIEHGATVVCLVPSRTDSAWYRGALQTARTRTDLPSRVKFITPAMLEPVGAPFPSAIITFSPRPLSDYVLEQLDQLGWTERLDETRALVDRLRGQSNGKKNPIVRPQIGALGE